MASTQQCSTCGFVTETNRESQAVYRCKAADCGHTTHADINAAININHTAGHTASACRDLGNSRSLKQQPESRATHRTPSQGNPPPAGKGGSQLCGCLVVPVPAPVRHAGVPV
ncbi:zinc ribbon domain-containing protein [Streptomyces sp. NPDC093982]|uniref:zinc ribbon domain-containing protein n=1 Tax=Streptomyces sp. NPDC093982 TaxID=3155077 RepID=UPI003439828E